MRIKFFICKVYNPYTQPIYSENQGKFGDLPGSMPNIRSFGVIGTNFNHMYIKDHKLKALNLAIYFQISLLLLIGTKTQAQVNSEIVLYETTDIAEKVSNEELYQERVTLLVPWFNALACTLVILNNGVQLVNHMKKKE